MVDEEEQDREQQLRPHGDRPACLLRKRAVARQPEPLPEEQQDHRYPPSGVRSPRSPSGRKTRIRMRIEKTIDCVQSEPGKCHGSPSFHDWIRPISTAPRTAPGRLPIPPSTAAVNAISPSWKPWSNRTVVTYRE